MEKRQTPQQNMRNVRAIALDILLQVMEEGKYCDRTLHRTLNREDTLSKQQRAFLTRLVEGTVEQAIRLDYIIDCFSKTKVVKMKPVIRENCVWQYISCSIWIKCLTVQPATKL